MRRSQIADHGFTLAEVLVAMLILMSGAMAAAGMFIVAAVATRTGLVETQTSVLAAAKMEQLLALVWGYDDSGAPVGDTSTDLSVEPASSGGVGLLPSPIDALDRNSPGYVDYLDGGGRWVGTGPAPPPRATYIRRWSIQPLADYPADAVVIRVLATTVVRAASLASSVGTSVGPDALLVAVRSRRAR